MGKIKKSPVVILFVIAAVLYVIIYILPAVTGVLRSSYTAEYGEQEIEYYIARLHIDGTDYARIFACLISTVS